MYCLCKVCVICVSFCLSVSVEELQTHPELDTDGDGTLSETETQVHTQTHTPVHTLSLLLSKCTLYLNYMLITPVNHSLKYPESISVCAIKFALCILTIFIRFI